MSATMNKKETITNRKIAGESAVRRPKSRTAENDLSQNPLERACIALGSMQEENFDALRRLLAVH